MTQKCRWLWPPQRYTCSNSFLSRIVLGLDYYVHILVILKILKVVASPVSGCHRGHPLFHVVQILKPSLQPYQSVKSGPISPEPGCCLEPSSPYVRSKIVSGLECTVLVSRDVYYIMGLFYVCIYICTIHKYVFLCLQTLLNRFVNVQVSFLKGVHV